MHTGVYGGKQVSKLLNLENCINISFVKRCWVFQEKKNLRDGGRQLSILNGISMKASLKISYLCKKLRRLRDLAMEEVPKAVGSKGHR